MSSKYYIRLRGVKQGPLSSEQLAHLASRGQFGVFHEISEDGRSWNPASAYPELLPSAVSSSVRVPLKPPPGDGAASSSGLPAACDAVIAASGGASAVNSGQDRGFSGSTVATSRVCPWAIWSLTLAILWTFGIGSMFAVVCGLISLERTSAVRDHDLGFKTALAGVLLGYLGLQFTAWGLLPTFAEMF